MKLLVIRSTRTGLTLRAALALSLLAAHTSRTQETAEPPAVRLVANLESYEGPSKFNGRPALVAFSPDGRRLATGGTDKTAYLHEISVK